MRPTSAELNAAYALCRSDWLADTAFADITSHVCVPPTHAARLVIRAGAAGTVAGIGFVPALLAAFEARDCEVTEHVHDGDRLCADTVILELVGNARLLLSLERTLLNLLGRLSGIATLTAAYVERVAGTGARIYDTRKTAPGWRLLDKYAVRAGGGCNHRFGLSDAVLIKDNHRVIWQQTDGRPLRELVRHARAKIPADVVLEIEVDTLEELTDALVGRPDIVLLDNMPVDQVHEAVQLRDQLAPDVELEASGGITLENVRAVAETGVGRISIGALTHSAPWLDLTAELIPVG